MKVLLRFNCNRSAYFHTLRLLSLRTRQLTDTGIHPEQTTPAYALVEVLRIGALAGAGGTQHGAQYANHCGATAAGTAGTLLGHAVDGTGLLVVLQFESVAIKKKKKSSNVTMLTRVQPPGHACLSLCSAVIVIVVMLVCSSARCALRSAPVCE